MSDNQNTAYEYYAWYHKQLINIIRTSSMEEIKQMLNAVTDIKNRSNKGEDKMHTTIKFAKVNPNAKIPSRGIENAGYDIYPCFDEDYMAIPPHTTELIPSGIASACDTDFVFILKERGSTGTKGIGQRCGVIDSGFRGEWFIPITNTTDKYLIIFKECQPKSEFVRDNIFYPYEKAIAQALLLPVPTADVEEYTYEEIQSIPSERGNGALGSSGK